MDVDGLEPDEDDAPRGDPSPSAPSVADPQEPPDPDLERIAADLADVERAMERLEDGSYWTDEVTGEPLSDELLATDPTARRRAASSFAPGPDPDDPPPPA